MPVLLSDGFEGAFPSRVPWRDFSLRFDESTVSGRSRSGSGQITGSHSESFNLTAKLLAIAADSERLLKMQRALQVHAADVLWEAPGSRVATHTLGLALRATRDVCTAPAPGAPDGVQIAYTAATAR